jgi:molybdopterin molybdotransferase
MVTPFVDQASSLLRVLAEADALILRPPSAPAAARGDWVEVIRLPALGV